MRPTPDNIKAIIAQQGYGGIKKAIRASYWDLYKAGYNRKEMKETLSQEFGTEDPFIRNIIYFQFNS
jgi:hypothetical protein|tara:strand:+ start:1116 stop:1316 length:201 start_codon:yes stop_codon:yes gene_type:complete